MAFDARRTAYIARRSAFGTRNVGLDTRQAASGTSLTARDSRRAARGSPHVGQKTGDAPRAASAKPQGTSNERRIAPSPPRAGEKEESRAMNLHPERDPPPLPACGGEGWGEGARRSNPSPASTPHAGDASTDCLPVHQHTDSALPLTCLRHPLSRTRGRRGHRVRRTDAAPLRSARAKTHRVRERLRPKRDPPPLPRSRGRGPG
jgi:hypothetical protein